MSDVDGSNNNIIGDETPITVVGGEDTPNNNFVDEELGSLSGLVQEDTNGDGNGDTPIAGVTITLRDENGNDIDSDPNTPGVQPTTTVTGDDGTYSFEGLAPGNFQVEETDLDGFNSVSDVDGSNDNVIGEETPITVVAGEENTDNNFVDEPQGLFETYINTVGADLDDQSLGGDDDGDGVANFAEFALSLNPETGFKVLPDGSPNDGYVLEFNDTTNALDSSFIRPADIPDGSNGEAEFITYTLQKSIDGQTWVDVPASELAPVVTPLPNDQEQVTYPNVESLAPAQLTRVLVSYNDARVDPAIVESYVTAVQGWQDHVVNPICETFSSPYMKPCLFLGTIPADFTGGLTIDLSTSVGSADITDFLDLANNSYYIEVIDGPREGELLDIESIDATTVTIANDTDLFSGPDHNTWLGDLDDSFAGSRILIREHQTVADYFPVDAYLAGSTPDNSALALLLDRNTGLVETLFLVQGPGANSNFWSPSVGGLSNENDRVIPPTEGTFGHNFLSEDAFDQLIFGEVRANDLNMPLKEGFNLVATGYPVDMSPLQRAMTPDNGFTGANNRAFADQILNWSADELAPLMPSAGDAIPSIFDYNSVFLLEVNNFFQWNNGDDVNDFTNRNDDLLFKRDRATVVNIYADPADNPNSDLPDYIVPSGINNNLP